MAVGLAATFLSCDSEGSPEPEVVVTELESFPDTLTQPRWTAVVTDDLYTFSFVYYGDERDPSYIRSRSIQGTSPGELHVLRLRDTGSGLPVFEAYLRSAAQDYSGSINPDRLGPLLDGEVQIHRWNVDGVFTGRIEGANDNGVGIAINFYARID